jgi:hypothetical protein
MWSHDVFILVKNSLYKSWIRFRELSISPYQNLILNVGNDPSCSRPSHVIVRDFINGKRRDKRNAMFHSQSQTLSKVVIERQTDRQTQCLEITSLSLDMQCGNQQEKEAYLLLIQTLGQTREREGTVRQTSSTARICSPFHSVRHQHNSVFTPSLRTVSQGSS